MMNLYDEKDDSLSRLFRDSQSNLDEMPSSAVWDRIESRLDANNHIKSPPQTGWLYFSRRYSVAASLILGAVSVGLVWRMFLNDNKTLSEQPSNAPMAQSLVKEQELPINATEAENIYQQEDSAQAANLKSVSSSTNNGDEFPAPLPAELPLVPEQKASPTIVLENTNVIAENNSLLSNTIAILNNDKEDKKNPTDDVNFAYSNSAGVGPDVNSSIKMEDDASEPRKMSAEKKIATKAERNNGARYASPSNISADEVQTINSIALEENVKMAKDRAADTPAKAKKREKAANKEEHFAKKLNPRMKMLAWLIGKWQDDSRYDGVSYEEWTIKDANTLQGRGYKIKGKDRLFEEAMTIKLDENLQQIFLQISVDDYKQPILYMLSGINPEELTFSLDMPSNDYPEKIILQRSLSGYTIITHNSSRELSPNQQSFLNNRNVVNSQRAVRNMRPSVGK